MTCARSAIAPPDQHGCFHVVTRCVRRSFLCGVDAVSGRSFEHRRDWVEARIRALAGIFAVRLHGFAVMSNHTHLIVEFDPGWVAQWCDREVAERSGPDPDHAGRLHRTGRLERSPAAPIQTRPN